MPEGSQHIASPVPSLPFLAETQYIMFQNYILQPHLTLRDNPRSSSPSLYPLLSLSLALASLLLPSLSPLLWILLERKEDRKPLCLCVHGSWMAVELGQGAAGSVTAAWVEGLGMASECN